MRHVIQFFIMGLIFSVSLVASAETKSIIAGAVVENMPSTDVVRFVVSPAKEKYDYKVVCAGDSIRVRLNDVGMADKEIKILKTPRGSTLKKARIVPQIQNKSVLQIHPRANMLEACDRTTVMSLEGNIVVSVALSDSQKARRARVLKAHQESKEVIREQASERDESSDAETSASAVVAPAPKARAQKKSTALTRETKASVNKGNEGSDKQKTLAGTIFDKTKKSSAAFQTDDEINSQNMKYAGGLLFAALIGFAAWYTKKKRNRFQIDEDNIDILTSKKVSSHQTLMVARVNGSRFLLAVGDKAVTSLGLIPVDGQPQADSALRADIRDAVRESLSKEPGISATPYSEIKDEDDSVVAALNDTMPANNFGADFQQAIDKIVKERNKPIRAGKARTDAGAAGAGKALSEAFAQSESASNVSGLISMARMRAAMENRTTTEENQYRA